MRETTVRWARTPQHKRETEFVYDTDISKFIAVGLHHLVLIVYNH